MSNNQTLAYKYNQRQSVPFTFILCELLRVEWKGAWSIWRILASTSGKGPVSVVMVSMMALAAGKPCLLILLPRCLVLKSKVSLTRRVINIYFLLLSSFFNGFDLEILSKYCLPTGHWEGHDVKNTVAGYTEYKVCLTEDGLQAAERLHETEVYIYRKYDQTFFYVFLIVKEYGAHLSSSIIRGASRHHTVHNLHFSLTVHIWLSSKPAMQTNQDSFESIHSYSHHLSTSTGILHRSSHIQGLPWSRACL